MSSELKAIEKKLQQLKANKEKEEKRLKDSIEKLTAKYNDDQKKLKDTFEGKIASEKKESESRIAVLTPEIAFYEKQQKEISKLEEQMEARKKELFSRLNAGKAGAVATEEKKEEVAEPVAEENAEEWHEEEQYSQY